MGDGWGASVCGVEADNLNKKSAEDNKVMQAKCASSGAGAMSKAAFMASDKCSKSITTETNDKNISVNVNFNIPELVKEIAALLPAQPAKQADMVSNDSPAIRLRKLECKL